MNEHAIREILEGGGGAGGKALRALLYLPGFAYGGAMRLRRALYGRGALPSFSAGVPVVSVGNVTAGGAGKTPLVAFIAKHFLASGRTPAILLRGYRAGPRADAESDEAVLYRRLCPGAPVFAGSDRVSSAARAVEAGADVILMDDGFQHLRLRRDLDIVLVDATAPWGGGNCIPGGLLREPLSALARVRAVVVTRADQASASALAGVLGRVAALAPAADVFTARHKPVRLREAGAGCAGGAGGGSLPLEALRGRRVVALSGIARPEAFRRTLQSLGAAIAGSFAGNDHRPFPEGFAEAALARARELDALLVTTAKDEARGLAVPALALDVEQELDDAPRFLGILGNPSVPVRFV